MRENDASTGNPSNQRILHMSLKKRRDRYKILMMRWESYPQPSYLMPYLLSIVPFSYPKLWFFDLMMKIRECQGLVFQSVELPIQSDGVVRNSSHLTWNSQHLETHTAFTWKWIVREGLKWNYIYIWNHAAGIGSMNLEKISIFSLIDNQVD